MRATNYSKFGVSLCLCVYSLVLFSMDRVVLSGSVTPSHYKLELTPDFTLFTFFGNQVVDVDVNGMFFLCVLN